MPAHQLQENNLFRRAIGAWNQWPSWLFLVAFVGLSIGLRLLSFPFSVIDHDEATYMVIAQELLKGKAYYIDVWDTKPIGIFWVFAAIINTFGHSVVAVRLFAAAVIGTTAYLLFLAARRWGQAPAAAALAGLAYPVLCSLHKWTFPANSEIFFNLFTALGLYFFLGKKNSLNFFLTGLAIGIGFLIKYFVLFDLAAFWLFYIVFFQKNADRQPLGTPIKNTAAMGLGFILPIAAVFFYYFFIGLFEAFWFNTFELPGKYAGGFEPLKALNFLLEFQLIYLPFVLAFYVLVFKGKDRKFALFVGLWTAMVWLATLLTGKFFLHYYFQLLLPLCFALSALPGSGTTTERFITRHRTRLLSALGFILLSWNIFLQYDSFILKPDFQRKTANYLAGRMQDADVLYCNQSNILYFLLKKSPPTRYVHPTLLTKEEHIKAVGVLVEAEFEKILGQKPRLLVLENPVAPALQTYVAKHCRLVKKIGPGIRVYQAVD